MAPPWPDLAYFTPFRSATLARACALPPKRKAIQTSADQLAPGGVFCCLLSSAMPENQEGDLMRYVNRIAALAAGISLSVHAGTPACSDPEPVYDVTKMHLKDNPVGDFCNRFIVTTTKDGEPLMFLNDHSVNRVQTRDRLIEEGTIINSVSVVDADRNVVCSTDKNEPHFGSSICYAPKVRTGTYVVTVNGTRFSNNPKTADPTLFLGYFYGVVTNRDQITKVVGQATESR